MRKLLSLALVPVATLIGVYALTKKPTPSPPSPVSNDSHLDSVGDNLLAREVADLRREISLLKPDKVVQAVERNSFPESNRPAELTPEEMLEAQERESRQNEQKLEATLRGQHRDREWARDTERMVDDSLSSYAPATKVESVTCAATLCRVVVQHSDENTKKNFLRAIGQTAPFASGTYYFYDGRTTTLYFVKEGEKPPLTKD